MLVRSCRVYQSKWREASCAITTWSTYPRLTSRATTSTLLERQQRVEPVAVHAQQRAGVGELGVVHRDGTAE